MEVSKKDGAQISASIVNMLKFFNLKIPKLNGSLLDLAKENGTA